MQQEIYVFIDNSFLFTQGYKHVATVAKLPANKKPSLDYVALRKFLEEHGTLKRAVLVGSDLAGSIFSQSQRVGFNVHSFPKYPDFKTGTRKEKGVDQKVCWEIAKTIFTNRDSTTNKKIILCTGDKDFMTILSDIHTSGWDFELWLWKNSYSPIFAQEVKVFGKIKELDTEWKKFIKIVDKK